MKQKIFILGMGLLLAACDPMPMPTPAPNPVTNQWNIQNVNRIFDDQAGVVCWIYHNNNQGGISCLPVSQTKLDH